MKLSEQEIEQERAKFEAWRPPIRAQAGAQKSMISTARAAKNIYIPA